MKKRKKTTYDGVFWTLAKKPGVYKIRTRLLREDHKESCKTLHLANDLQAEEACEAWKQEIQGKKRQPGGPLTIGDLLDANLKDQEYHKNKAIDDVRTRIEKHLRPALLTIDGKQVKLGDLPAKDLTFDILRDYVLQRRKEPTRGGRLTCDRTVNREIDCLSHGWKLKRDKLPFFNFAVHKVSEDGGIRTGVFSEENYQRLFHRSPSFAKLPLSVIRLTGTRPGELLETLWEWVDWAEDPWVIRAPGVARNEAGTEAGITKNTKEHGILIFAEARELLKWAYQTRNPDCPYIFQKDGERLTYSKFYNAYKEVRNELGLKNLPYDLKRLAVVSMLRDKQPTNKIMAMTGHRDPKMIIRYGQMKLEDAKQVARDQELYLEKIRKGDKMSPFTESTSEPKDLAKTTSVQSADTIADPPIVSPDREKLN
jgi:integrase